MTTHTVIGIDPGLHGGIAVYAPDFGGIDASNVYDMPITSRGIDIPKLARIIKRLTWPKTIAVVENVHSRPRQAGQFNFGLYTGIVHGVLGAVGVPFELVTPQEWKRAMGLTRSNDETKADTKSNARALASQLFPALAPHFVRVKDDGRAEALLLAVYYANRKR